MTARVTIPHGGDRARRPGPAKATASAEAALERARRKRAEAELARARRDLEVFAYSVAHDLRNPLQAISGFTDLLLDSERLDGESRELLQRVATAGARMQGVIDQMLVFAKPRRELKRRIVDLGLLAREVADELQRSDPARRVEWLLEEGVSSSCDPGLIREALVHLLENAWKYTAPVERARIEFGVTERRGLRTFFVRDNGIGFDMAADDELPVARFDLKAAFDGTGLGLPTVRRIVARHGGSIEATSAVGRGATFYFTAGSPIARPDTSRP
jgi:signal transduction histidine kinase